MKRFLLLITALSLLTGLAACGKAEPKASSATELYEAGLELISVMEEMIQSQEYAAIMGSPSIDSMATDADTGDYDSPIAVYQISMPNITAYLKRTNAQNMELLNSLSRNLRKQVENRFSFSVMINYINSTKGNNAIAFSSIYVATDKNDDLRIDEPTVLLYIFEEGIPIAVSFSEYGAMHGQFVFLEDNFNYSTLKAFFKELDCTVKRVDID